MYNDWWRKYLGLTYYNYYYNDIRGMKETVIQVKTLQLKDGTNKWSVSTDCREQGSHARGNTITHGLKNNLHIYLIFCLSRSRTSEDTKISPNKYCIYLSQVYYRKQACNIHTYIYSMLSVITLNECNIFSIAIPTYLYNRQYISLKKARY